MKNIDERAAVAAEPVRRWRAWAGSVGSGLAALPAVAMAQSNNKGFGDTQDSMCGFLGNITSLLNMGSIAVVTIAIIFAGFQIAFAHKRISEVAPILIGALLIGAAGQIATMIIGDGGDTCTAALNMAESVLRYA